MIKFMKKLLVAGLFGVALTFTGLIAVPEIVSAHPGNTDSSGCHTCRTNCPNWGLSTGEYHCHNSKGASQPKAPIRSTWGSGGTGFTTPWPAYGSGSSLYSSSRPSCPTNSYYDGISSCKCNYGYVVSGGSCVSGDSVCRADIGFMSRYDGLSNSCKCMVGYSIGSTGKCEYVSPYKSSYPSLFSDTRSSASCPANSSQSLLDSDSCTCNKGYETNKAKTACVRISRASYNKQCISEFGKNSVWSGKTDSDGDPTCICKKKFTWNAAGTKCEKAKN